MDTVGCFYAIRMSSSVPVIMDSVNVAVGGMYGDSMAGSGTIWQSSLWLFRGILLHNQ